ncbi:S24 family peptidase [Rhodoligotrophos defluvii]|uniref:S24 family peptidase n=1 Tax=Rhodoligotrophos defluvii TaxID=2561934 RepID=UPI0010C9D565|nr:helix-turn-helix transcriptional regulator [Rhodoligotrophos defluvii]
MFLHDHIWSAIDELAARSNMSTSGLAKSSGLDPTTFNKSKRFTADGRPRWPTTESVAKILRATGSNIVEFAMLVNGQGGCASPNSTIVPLIGLAQVESSGYFDAKGLPSGSHWDALAFPGLNDQRVYALEVNGDEHDPIYRDGDVIVVSPTASLRRGDRVVFKQRDGKVLIRTLYRRTARVLETLPLDGEGTPATTPLEKVEWVARIVWVSQ